VRFDADGEAIDGECCQDPTRRVCFTCRRHIGIRLRTLATNLSVAGALCAAFADGWRWGSSRRPR